jgi:hypothetical protein
VVALLVPLGIVGIFGWKPIEDNIVSILCTVLSLATIFLYQLWRGQSKLRKDTNQINTNVADLALSRSPFSVSGPRISGELTEMLDLAKEWSFKGGSGRWQRERVLPQLSRERNRSVPYRMLILDPTEHGLCQQYADYRNKNRVDGALSTAESVRNELLACIVAGAWYSKNTRIAAEVYLAQTYSPLRQDMSAEMVAVTVADQSQSGLFVPSSSWYYESMTDEFSQHCERSPKIDYEKTENLVTDWRNFKVDDVESVLRTTRVRHLDGTLRDISGFFSLSVAEMEGIGQLVFKGRSA